MSEEHTSLPDAIERVERFYEDVVRAAQAGDCDGYAWFFDARGSLVLPKAPPLVGFEAVRDWARGFLAKWSVRADVFEVLECRIGTEMAFQRYRVIGAYLAKERGDAMPFDHNYVDVLVKDASGSWRFAVHQAGIANRAATVWD